MRGGVIGGRGLGSPGTLGKTAGAAEKTAQDNSDV